MKFCWAVTEELSWQSVSVVSFILAKFLSSKRGELRKKIWIKISCGYAYLHGMSFTTTKFLENLLSGFRGVALTNCFSSIFNFGYIFKFKKGHFSPKKNHIGTSWGYAHLHIMSFITTKFYETLLSGYRGVVLTICFSSIFHFGQIS